MPDRSRPHLVVLIQEEQNGLSPDEFVHRVADQNVQVTIEDIRTGQIRFLYD